MPEVPGTGEAEIQHWVVYDVTHQGKLTLSDSDLLAPSGHEVVPTCT